MLSKKTKTGKIKFFSSYMVAVSFINTWNNTSILKRVVKFGKVFFLVCDFKDFELFFSLMHNLQYYFDKTYIITKLINFNAYRLARLAVSI